MESDIELKLGWFHRYPARFAVEALEAMFAGTSQRLGRYPSRVLDPYMGTGSTLAAARQLGITRFRHARLRGYRHEPAVLGYLRLRLDPAAHIYGARLADRHRAAGRT